MKGCCLYILLILSTALAFAAPEPYAHSLSFTDDRLTFFKHLVNGETATYSVCVGDDISDKEKVADHMDQVFLYALNYWFDETRKWINFTRKGKSNFKDILEVLDHRKFILKVPCGHFEELSNKRADLTIVIKKDMSKDCGGAIACNNTWDGIIFMPGEINFSHLRNIIEGKERYYNLIMTHEMGHTFGLSDRYLGTSYKNSFAYNSGQNLPTVMDSNTNHLSCDDIDGFITTIRRMDNNNNYEFNSFCNNGVAIRNGKALNLEKSKIEDIKEEFVEFDSQLNIVYPNKTTDDNSYYINATLYNFNKYRDSDELLRMFGFNIDKENISSSLKLEMHAYVEERSTPRKEVTQWQRFLKGSGYMTLFLDGEKEQELTWELKTENDVKYLYISRAEMSSGMVYNITEKPAFPFIDYYPTREPTFIPNFWDETQEQIKYLGKKFNKFLSDNGIYK